MDNLIGQTGKVIEEIDNFNEKGQILLNGMEWMARGTEDEKQIPLASEVIVREIKGAHAVVERINK